MPPPATMPSATAACVAASAPSVRRKRSLSATSVGAPTRITARLGREPGDPLLQDLDVALVHRARELGADLRAAAS